MKNCRGIGLVGARVMSGEKSGVSARIRQQFPLVIYVHCFSHRLNLVIGKSCKVHQITLQCLGNIKSIYNFLNCPKKKVEFAQSIEKTTKESLKKRLKNTCETRWVERHEAVGTIFELLERTSVQFTFSARFQHGKTMMTQLKHKVFSIHCRRSNS